MKRIHKKILAVLLTIVQLISLAPSGLALPNPGGQTSTYTITASIDKDLLQYLPMENDLLYVVISPTNPDIAIHIHGCFGKSDPLLLCRTKT